MQYPIFYPYLLFQIIYFSIKLFEIKYSTGICILNAEEFNIMANNTRELTYICKTSVLKIKFIVIITPFFFFGRHCKLSYFIVYNTKIFSIKFTLHTSIYEDQRVSIVAGYQRPLQKKHSLQANMFRCPNFNFIYIYIKFKKITCRPTYFLKNTHKLAIRENCASVEDKCTLFVVILQVKTLIAIVYHCGRNTHFRQISFAVPNFNFIYI